ncbi:hydroxypyruvate isomerase [Gemmobacter aquaticus]|uniref:Hydroxypyruvate isomerase n=1 Tax=Gemmobacter aquaticus TaxID=490185 RepID=A0A918DAL6_9RHOB|nr:TIM barrel protein [Gemmobacter aquaticus]GGO23340.1 hydroxypyruvate isomerase [Gemmobacter aquaticus]
MTQFSANLGFLWTELPLPMAIAAAKAAGFAAVECHWPYDTPAEETARALRESGLRMLGINTVRGKPGENGLSALPGCEAEARAAIDQALGYATAIGAGMVHVMAGCADGDEAHAVFVTNLAYAAQRAAECGITILIEPLNRHDAPGYFLKTTDQACAIIHEVGAPNVKLMFDCYHVGRTEGDITTRFKALQPLIGHVQFASVPDRGPPDSGELNFGTIFAAIADTGWVAPLGAEYRPIGPTSESLGWMARWRQV